MLSREREGLFLEHHGLQANLDKTVVLAKFVGYQHTKAWSKNTERHPDRGLCVRISTANGAVLLPIRSSHKYLGVQLSYKHMIRDTVQYRIKCANSSFARINVALKRTSKLSPRPHQIMAGGCPWHTPLRDQ